MADTVTLADLNRNEVRILRQALKRLQYETQRSLKANISNGWTPQPGKVDMNPLILQTINKLIDRLPYPNYPVDLNQGEQL
jgi:hypothetical protein